MATIALGAFVGIVNGVLMAFFRVPAFVATLGSLCVARGVALLMANGSTFNNLSGNSALGNLGFAWLGFNRPGGVPIRVIALAIIALAAGLLPSRTACGRWFHSSGSNARAAELSGSAAWAAGDKGPVSIIVNDPANPYWFTEGQVAKKTTEDLGHTATVPAHKGDANVESNLVDAAITNGATRSNGYKTVLSQYQGLVNRTRNLQARARPCGALFVVESRRRRRRGGLRPQGIPREAGSERNLEKMPFRRGVRVPTTDALAVRGAALLDDEVVRYGALAGGDLSRVLRLELASGRSVIAKSGPFPDREARMLAALRAAGGPAPEPLASDGTVLVLEDLGPAKAPSGPAWRRLGEALRGLQVAPGEGFGWEEDFAFGSVAIRNGRRDDWADFWIENRILDDVLNLPPDVARRLGNARNAIRERLPERPRAGLLHGDLWTGNIHFGAGEKAWLIDPACYRGHGEADLAMLTLFGSPPPDFWQGYGPLDPGWERRRAVYQLWPALVHLRLFGSGYRGLVEGLLARIGA